MLGRERGGFAKVRPVQGASSLAIGFPVPPTAATAFFAGGEAALCATKCEDRRALQPSEPGRTADEDLKSRVIRDLQDIVDDNRCDTGLALPCAVPWKPLGNC
jgi:hypothetical protein